MARNIWSAEVATDRRSFINWICRHFHHKKYNKSEHIMLNEILDVYKYMYPRTQWEIDDMMDVLYDIGYLWEDMKSLNLSIRVESLTDLSKDCLMQFMHIAKQDVKPAIRKLMGIAQFQKDVTNAGIAQQVAMTMDDHLFIFYNMWCIDTRRPEWSHIPPAFKKAIKGDVFRAYKAFCIRNGFAGVENKILRLFLKGKGHTESTGYACGRSGQSFFHWLYIPGSGGFKADGGFLAEEELSMATRYNQLLIRVGREYYLNTGTLLSDISDEYLAGVASERVAQIKLDVPGLMDNQTSAISKEGGDDIVSLEEDSRMDSCIQTEALQVDNDLVESARKSKEGSHSSGSSDDSFVDNSSSVDLADSQTDVESYTEDNEFTEDQLEGPTELGEFTDTENALAESEIEIEDETAAILSRLGISNEEVKKISGKTIKTK